MNRYFLAIFFLILGTYGLVEAWPLLAGPSLSVETPQNFASFPDSIVEIKGHSGRVASLTLNGAPLLSDQKGTFVKTLAFAKGASILTFVATDRFGRTITESRTIFVP